MSATLNGALAQANRAGDGGQVQAWRRRPRARSVNALKGVRHSKERVQGETVEVKALRPRAKERAKEFSQLSTPHLIPVTPFG